MRSTMVRGLLAEARAARQAGNTDHALALVRRAREQAPQSAEPAFLLCCLLLEREDPEANNLIEPLDSFAAFAPGWEELGQALLPRGKAAAQVAFGRAAEAYAAMERNTPRADIAYRLGQVLRRLGRTAAARDAMRRATMRDPKAAQAWFALGLLCQDLQDHGGAIQAFGAALAARPDWHEAAFNLGVACQESRDMEGALDAYAAAWRLRPGAFGRIAQALASPASGRLWLHPSALQRALSARA